MIILPFHCLALISTEWVLLVPVTQDIFYTVICLLMRLYCLFYVAAFCTVVLKCCTNILLRTKHHLLCTFCSFSFSSDSLLLNPVLRPISSSPILFYISSFLAPLVLHDPKFLFPLTASLFFLLPDTIHAFFQLSVSLIRYLPLFYPFSFHCHDN